MLQAIWSCESQLSDFLKEAFPESNFAKGMVSLENGIESNDIYIAL